MVLQLHPTVHALLTQRATALKMELPAFIERILAQYGSHKGFGLLMHHAKSLPEYVNIFSLGPRAITLSVRISAKHATDTEQCEALLTAYSIGIANRDMLELRTISLTAKLALFTE